MGSEQDFIAEDDIFIDAEGKVVEKKDARTKLASKGSRVLPADVEKYKLKTSASMPKETPTAGEPEAPAPKVEDIAPVASEKIRPTKKGKE